MLLSVLAISAPMLALLPPAQDPATDWHKVVNKAATSRRYGLRLAAAKKIAKAGAAAIPAVDAYAERNGRNALPLAIVDAISKAETVGPAVFDQLIDWAEDRDFYWRPYAFLGLARRAPLAEARKAELTELFTAHRDDPAWLVATHSRFGLVMLGAGDPSPRPDDDPRLAARLAQLLLRAGKPTDLQPLVDALANERTFLGMPWGQQEARESNKAIRAVLGDDHPGRIEDKNAAIAAVRAALTKRFGQELKQPTIVRDAAIELVGGIESLSCKSGDLFLQWTADGQLYAGIDARPAGQLPTAAWQELSKQRTELPIDKSLGMVICDALRLKWSDPALEVRFAPSSLPEPGTVWFERLANALATADKKDLAAAIRESVEQFGLR
ncbi:MAG: hypothetical protein NXI31_04490 [bacterium]|nr:hypothetical protein [bacterium]